MQFISLLLLLSLILLLSKPFLFPTHRYSELQNSIAIKLVEDPCFKNTVSAVADYHRPDGFESGFFTLKDECWDEVDIFFSHFTNTERNRLEMRYASKRPKNATKRDNIPPRKLESASKYFRNISELILQSRILHSIIFIVVKRALRSKDFLGSLTNVALYVS